MKTLTRATVVLVALVAAGCSSLPPAAIAVGDTCTNCRRTIRDTRLASETIDSVGRAYKFRTVSCMASYLARYSPDVKAIYVTDFPTGRLVKATAVTFVKSSVSEGKDRITDYLAFYSEKAARDLAAREKTTAIEWDELLAAAKATPGN